MGQLFHPSGQVVWILSKNEENRNFFLRYSPYSSLVHLQIFLPLFKDLTNSPIRTLDHVLWGTFWGRWELLSQCCIALRWQVKKKHIYCKYTETKL